MQRAAGAAFLAYAVALATAIVVGHAVPAERPLWIAAWGDVAATLAVFAFSFGFRNSSFYDPYWSLAPIAIAVYWTASAERVGVDPTRQTAVLVLVGWWGARLTWNWVRSWGGLTHEDWRYVRLRQQTGGAYWLVSLAGLHMMPTVIVFLGLLPLYPALSVGVRPWGLLDALAVLVTGGAVLLEQTADRQLLRFRRSDPDPRSILASGLWARSRHPNYLGEIGFWWGLFLFGLSARPGWWWSGIGALAITLLFRGVSLPLIETRMLERRPGYAEHQKRVPLLLPRWRGAGR
jgi:steroid 5-alpha reductase family enzyme